MTKIYKEDVFYYSNKAELALYVSDSSRELSSNIDSFIANSKEKLVGKQFDAVRAHLELYFEAYKRLSEISAILSNNITAVNNKMLNYMEHYSVVDNSKINEIEKRIDSIESLMNSLNIKNKITKESEYYHRVLAVLNQKKDKLLQLEPLDRELFDSFMPVVADIKRFKSAVKGIQTISVDLK